LRTEVEKVFPHLILGAHRVLRMAADVRYRQGTGTVLDISKRKRSFACISSMVNILRHEYAALSTSTSADHSNNSVSSFRANRRRCRLFSNSLRRSTTS